MKQNKLYIENIGKSILTITPIKKKFLIGIDPDCSKSGVSIIKDGKVQLQNLTFFELFDYLNFYRYKEEKPTVYIECGFLNKSNFHLRTKDSDAYNSKIGERIGANFEATKKIIEMLEYLEITYHKIKPTKSKLNAEQFRMITGITQRTNQEQRDSYMLIHGI